jgi:ATP-dependent DNA helicase RecG
MTDQEIQAVIQSGEGYKIEFKRNVNSDLVKEMVAFANSSGGRIFVGIDDDNAIRGITVTNELKSKVVAMASDCDPSISVELEAFKNLLIIHIPEGRNKPYRCTNEFYIRNGPNSLKLSTEEIRDFFKEQGKVHFDEMLLHQVKYPMDLDENAINKFIALLNSPSPISHDHLLINLGVVYLEGSTPVMNNAGALFFAKFPARLTPQSVVTCVVYRGTSKVNIIDKKTFDFSLIDNIDESLAFLKRHLNMAYEIKGKRRIEKLELPEVALREAVVNAVAHRDYFEKGATVMIEMFDNRVEISNPGGLPKGLNVEDFGRRTLARNPLIASLLNRVGYIEKLGTGIQRIKEAMKTADLPAPEFEFNSFFTVVFRKEETISHRLAEMDVAPQRKERMDFILVELRVHQAIDVSKVAKKFKTSTANIRRDLRELEENGLIISTGATTNKKYQLMGKKIDSK